MCNNNTLFAFKKFSFGLGLEHWDILGFLSFESTHISLNVF